VPVSAKKNGGQAATPASLQFLRTILKFRRASFRQKNWRTSTHSCISPIFRTILKFRRASFRQKNGGQAPTPASLQFFRTIIQFRRISFRQKKWRTSTHSCISPIFKNYIKIQACQFPPKKLADKHPLLHLNKFIELKQNLIPQFLLTNIYIISKELFNYNYKI